MGWRLPRAASRTLVVLAWLGCGCGGSASPMGPAPVPSVPSPPAPTRVGDILLELIAMSPDPAVPLARGTTQSVTARLRYDAASSLADPLFLVGTLKQWNGPTVADSPGDFHFATPGRAGETEAVIERRLIESPGVLWIGWTLAMRNPDGTTFAGASFTTTFTIQ